jgi:DUF1009 family protein
VLAVEAGEGVAAAVERAAKLRQWGSLPRRRRGVLAVRSTNDLSAPVMGTIGQARYTGAVALAREGNVQDVVAAADAAGLFVLAGGKSEDR